MFQKIFVPPKDEVNGQCSILNKDETRILYKLQDVVIKVKYKKIVRQCSSLFRSSHGLHVGRKSEYDNVTWLLVAWCMTINSTTSRNWFHHYKGRETKGHGHRGLP